MMYIIDITLLLILSAITFQDVTERMISWYLMPLLFMVVVAGALLKVPYSIVLHHFLINIAIFLFQLLCVALYYYSKNKNLHFIDSALGWGDILFIVALCAAFSPLNFIVFYVSASLLSLLGFLLYKTINKNAGNQVPFAGTLSVAYMLLLIFKYLNEFDVYSDLLLISLLK